MIVWFALDNLIVNGHEGGGTTVMHFHTDPAFALTAAARPLVESVLTYLNHGTATSRLH